MLDFLDVPEALYGGAAGGGKSSALLMSALRYVDIPGYSALILRRTFTDLALPNAIMDRAKQWLLGHPGISWNEQAKRFTFPSKATLSFGFCETIHDVYRYQGAEFQFIGIDELTQWPESSYLYLMSRLRRLSGVPIPLRMRAASNPGGVGHEWVFRRFIKDKSPQRVFISAKLCDNPHLDKDEYSATLSRLDDVNRRRLLDGDWYVAHEGLVYPDFHLCVRPHHEFLCQEGSMRVGGIDFGWHNPFAAVWGWVDHDGVLWIDSERYQSKVPISVHAEALPRDVTWYVDPSGADQKAELRRAGHRIVDGPNAIMPGIALVNEWIHDGRLRVSDRCVELRREAGLYRYPEGNKTGEIPVDADNHALAALRYLVMSLAKKRHLLII